MKKLNRIQKLENLNDVFALDEPGPGDAHHLYEVVKLNTGRICEEDDTFRTRQEQLDPDTKYLFKKPKGAIHESKITIRFWIVTIILAALTIITLKIR